jgi:hypothetical protein
VQKQAKTAADDECQFEFGQHKDTAIYTGGQLASDPMVLEVGLLNGNDSQKRPCSSSGPCAQADYTGTDSQEEAIQCSVGDRSTQQDTEYPGACEPTTEAEAARACSLTAASTAVETVINNGHATHTCNAPMTAAPDLPGEPTPGTTERS